MNKNAVISEMLKSTDMKPERLEKDSIKVNYKLNLPVSLWIRNKMEVHALLDSGAYGSFIDINDVKHHDILMIPLEYSRAPYNMNGTKVKKDVTHKVILLIEYQDHQEWITLGLTQLTQPILLGYN